MSQVAGNRISSKPSIVGSLKRPRQDDGTVHPQVKRIQLGGNGFVVIHNPIPTTADVAATNSTPRIPQGIISHKLPPPASVIASATPRRSSAITPVAFLKAILAEKQSLSKTPHYDGSSFSKPSEEELHAYNTELVNAIRGSDIKKLREYHEDGKSLNACNRFGESLIHMACRRGNKTIVAFLIEEAKVNLVRRDDYGRTPMHDAAWTSEPNFEVMEILLRNVNPSLLLAEDVRGHTCFEYARREHWGSWIKFLAERKSLLVSRMASEDSSPLTKTEQSLPVVG